MGYILEAQNNINSYILETRNDINLYILETRNDINSYIFEALSDKFITFLILKIISNYTFLRLENMLTGQFLLLFIFKNII